jgi:hypothetical protein
MNILEMIDKKQMIENHENGLILKSNTQRRRLCIKYNLPKRGFEIEVEKLDHNLEWVEWVPLGYSFSNSEVIHILQSYDLLKK